MTEDRKGTSQAYKEMYSQILAQCSTVVVKKGANFTEYMRQKQSTLLTRLRKVTDQLLDSGISKQEILAHISNIATEYAADQKENRNE